MQFPDNWFGIFQEINGEVLISNTLSTGDNPLTGGKELNDLCRSAIVGNTIRIVLGS